MARDDPYQVTQLNTGEIWTRISEKSACAWADKIARKRNTTVVVTISETDDELYRAEPEEVDEIERAVVRQESYEQI